VIIRYAIEPRNAQLIPPQYRLFLCDAGGKKRPFAAKEQNFVPPKTSCISPAKAKPGADVSRVSLPGGDDTPDSWAEFARVFRHSGHPLPPPWAELFEPLRTAAPDGLTVIGQIGQSLDGRIATVSGHSKYINGPAGITHLHRLRSLVDAVLVGVGTALADNPQLTVRRVAGPHPARIVLDPNGRLPATAKVFNDDGIRRLWLTAEGTRRTPPSDVEVVGLPVTEGRIAPSTILAALAERGLRRILIEGGAHTLSRFLAAGCLDRLHVTVAPIILGSGQPGVILPPVERADQALRAPMRIYQLEDEVLFDCDLSAQRVAIGRAKTST
jgi:diaminohydroxyphosphoribosylaminopyrimidine deaminase/5-amino-6-(5-phosphoribosylamino)uracil reductase